MHGGLEAACPLWTVVFCLFTFSRSMTDWIPFRLKPNRGHFDWDAGSSAGRVPLAASVLQWWRCAKFMFVVHI